MSHGISSSSYSNSSSNSYNSGGVPGNSSRMDGMYRAKRNSGIMNEREDGGGYSNTLTGKKRLTGSYNNHVSNASMNSSSSSIYNSNSYDHLSTSAQPNALIQQQQPNYHHQSNMINGSSTNNSISMNHQNNYIHPSFPPSTIYSAYSNPTSGLPMLYNPIMMNTSNYPASISTIPVSSARQPPLPPGPPPTPSSIHHQQYQYQQQSMKSSSSSLNNQLTPQYKYKPLFYKK